MVPDAVTDSEQRRGIGASRKREAVKRVRLEALRRGSYGVLVLLTLPMRGDLYGLEAHREARRQVVASVDGWPAYYVLGEGKSGGLHAHIVTVTEAVEDWTSKPAGAHCEVIERKKYDRNKKKTPLRRVLAYLSSPRLEGAGRRNHRRQVSEEVKEAAAERYLQARAAAAAAGRSRLPACSGVVNVPPRGRAADRPALILACLAVQLAEWQERARRLMAVMTLRRSQRRGKSPAGIESHKRRCWPVYGGSVNLSRRPALIGHARPPPQRQPGCWSMTPKHPG